jgi:hypothetical protein
VLFALALLAASFLITGPHGQGQGRTEPRGQGETVEEHVPVAEYAAPEPSDAQERALRRLRGHRFDKRDNQPLAELPPGVENLPLINHWDNNLPALPAAQSDLVVLGTITDDKAYLSPDKTGVYSEFGVKVEAVLKSDARAPVTPGNVITATREGGGVRFPSGRTQYYRIHRQGLPRAGGRYLLFLKENQDAQDFTIITGYALSGGEVLPLDGGGAKERAGRLPFAAYEGVDESTFLDDVRKAISCPSCVTTN